MVWKTKNTEINLSYSIWKVQKVPGKEEPKMLKEYLSEAVSLLAEAALGSPVQAQAQTCFRILVCQCGCCGADKGLWDKYCCCEWQGGSCYRWCYVKQCGTC